MTRDYTVAPIEVRHVRLIGLLDDIANEVRFTPEAVDVVDAVIDMIDEARILVRSLQGAPGELDLVAD